MTTFAQSLARWIKQTRLDLVRTNALAAMQNEIEDRPFKKGKAKNKPVTVEDLLKAARAAGSDLLDRLASDIDLRTWASKFFDDQFKTVNPYESLELDRLNISFTDEGLRFDGRLVGNEQEPDVEVPEHVSTSDVQRALKQLGQVAGSGAVSWDMRSVPGYGHSSSLFSTYTFWGVFKAPTLVDDVVGTEVLKQMAEKLLSRQESALDEQRRLAGIFR